MQQLTEEQFYKAADRMVSSSQTGRFATKSPALILPEERKDGWRKKYFHTLVSRIKEGFTTKYLFHLDKTKNLILKGDVKIILNEWKDLLNHKNLDMRFTNEDFESCVIGDQQAVFKKGNKRFLATKGTGEYESLVKSFDTTFARASSDNKKIIKELI